MIKLIKIALTIVVIIVLTIAYFLGFFSFLNRPFNYIVYGPVDTSCNEDSDCALKRISCGSICSCGSPVNKNWKMTCPFGYEHLFVYCEPCASPSELKLKCIENECGYA